MGYVALKLESRGAYRVLVGKPEKNNTPWEIWSST
jgi:hypothetical protein